MNMFCWCLFGNIINVAAQRKEKKNSLSSVSKTTATYFYFLGKVILFWK